MQKPLMLAALICSASHVWAVPINLVVNPSFESPAGAGLTTRYTTPGVPAGFSWTVGGGGVDLVETAWIAQDGVQSLDLNADVGHPAAPLTPPGSVSQTLLTTPGVTYLIQFWMAANPVHAFPADEGPAVKTMDVAFGSTTHSYSFDVTGHTVSDLGWQHAEFLATAGAGNTLLSFLSTSSGYAAMTIDNVSVTAVPENGPTAFSFALAVGGLAILHRRLKNRAA
jgi:choice-of-anchor C domain-containing protein